MEEYNGDMIFIERLIEFFPKEYWEWDDTGKINLEDMSVVFQKFLILMEIHGNIQFLNKK